MSSESIRRLLYAVLFLAYLLHNDVWLWEDARLVLGLPVGLGYHVAFCLGVAFVMWLLVRFAWPRDLDLGEER